MTEETELLIRKSALKDVEIWLNQQYLEINKRLKELVYVPRDLEPVKAEELPDHE